MAPTKRSNKRGQVLKNVREVDEEYLDKRARNNLAVKVSRQRAKERVQEANNKIAFLKVENKDLEEKIKLRSAELAAMQELYAQYYGTTHQTLN